MTPEQIVLVQDSFKQVAAIKDKAAALFYNRLFELDPSLRPLFKGDIAEQGQKLMATIGIAVQNLKRPDAILDTVRALGVRHKAYGVTDAHYDTVATALLDTLATAFGPAFTPDLRAAWTAMYGMVADVMKQAAAETAPA
ncbi:globin family protein [Azospirillum thermophilum]|uniref:Hemin receptor n=1 Tax=Azospirillum thermophilum TaxID=2202148 RepID=A0A2S2CPA7_9PROT|nr:globin family protein [Azospirillum thermophilum]AWK86298.1 hemin receptor [Azospirillum thermophilum]